MDHAYVCGTCGALNPSVEPFCLNCGSFRGEDDPPVALPVAVLQHGPITYGVGNEHNPVDPFGRISLTITDTGAASLDHVSRAGRRGWAATVRPEVLAGLRAAIAGSGFPEVPSELPVPDSEARYLAVGPFRAEVWPRAAAQPPYAQVFRTLDAIADEMSGGTIQGRLPEQSLVTSIRSA